MAIAIHEKNPFASIAVFPVAIFLALSLIAQNVIMGWIYTTYTSKLIINLHVPNSSGLRLLVIIRVTINPNTIAIIPETNAIKPV